MKKILIIDDHEIVLKGMSQMLKSEGYDVIESTNANQALALLKHVNNICLMVCDLSLPTIAQGQDLIQQVRTINEQMPIIVFTMHEELWTIKALMEIGVDGIVLKGDNPKELLYAVSNVIDGKKYFSEQFCKIRETITASKGILSKKEIEIIREIAAGHKNRDIANLMCVSEKTIEFHRCSILRKLGAKNIAEATKRACEMGLLA